MNVVFRVDANEHIGTGHLSRCMALANLLASRGANCSFLSHAEGLGTLTRQISAAGHRLIALTATAKSEFNGIGETPHAGWLPYGWRADLAACEAALRGEERPEWLVVDHYALDGRWESALMAKVDKILVIDDLADRDHSGCLLLDQNFLPNLKARYEVRIPSDCQLLLGPDYALLRPEFAATRELALRRLIPESPQRLLVMFGGADMQDATGAVVDALIEISFHGHVDVVAGPLYAHTSRLHHRVGRLRSASLHLAPTEVADLMAQADLAIGAPGVTSYERCTLGVPTIAIAVADSQQALAKALHEAGVHSYIGRFDALKAPALCEALSFALEGRCDFASQRRLAAALCDGLGAWRVREWLIGQSATDPLNFAPMHLA